MNPGIDHAFAQQLFPTGRPQRVVALVGNPNVGKSTFFNHLTGQDVQTAHYPGKTADVNVGSTTVDGREFTVMDLPGTYSIGGSTEEEWTAHQVLLHARPDAAIVVLDSGNLARNLVVALHVLDLGIPTVFALNLTDEALRAGVAADAELLQALTGARTVRTVAVEGVGVHDVVRAALDLAADPTTDIPRHTYGPTLERVLGPLVSTIEGSGFSPFGLAARGSALQMLVSDGSVLEAAAAYPGLIRVAEEARAALAALAGEPPSQALMRERHGLAGVLAERTVQTTLLPRAGFGPRLRALSTRALTGVPMLIGALLGIFGLLFFVGGLLAEAFSSLWQTFASPLIQGAIHGLVPNEAIARTLLWGFDAGIEASLSIGLPYILTFYFLLALLEDSGYLNSVAFLADRAMHRLGLHGRAIIPLVAGAGCSVPAVLSVRVLPTERERFLAATLVSFVPCSARTAVVLGAVGAYIGWFPALGVFMVTTVVTIGVGIAMDRLVPGRSTGFVMEMFPFRRPRVRIVTRKAWVQFREFLVVATPLVVAGSIVLGGLYESGWLFSLSRPLEPVVVGWLGLPAVTGLTLLFGVLRKEFALQLLATLAIAVIGTQAGDLLGFMSRTDLFVYALVNTLAMPCISTVAVLGRVLGWRRAAGVMGVTVSVALLVGGLFARLLPLLGPYWAN